MMNRRWAAIGLGIALAAGCASNEHTKKDYLIRHAGVTLSQAAELAETHAPGRAVKAELKYTSGRVVYEVEILDAINKPRTLLVDADTGKIVKGL